MKCPRCQTNLVTKEYEGEQVDVCPACKGEWLDSGELQDIVENHEEVFTPEELEAVDGVNKEIFTAEAVDHDELLCPECVEVEMEHFNYGGTSGVILHKCTECNGIWMDKGELQQIEKLVDGWKSHLGGDVAKYGGILKKIEINEELDLEKSVSISRFGFVNTILRQFTS